MVNEVTKNRTNDHGFELELNTEPMDRIQRFDVAIMGLLPFLLGPQTLDNT